MRSDSSDRWQDDAGGMRRIKLRGNMKERCNVLSLEKYSPEKKKTLVISHVSPQGFQK